MDPSILPLLPTLTLYKHNCHSSQSLYLAYLASTTQIKLIKFTLTPTLTITNINNIVIPLDPVSSICVGVVKGQKDIVQVGVSFVHKFVVYQFYQGTVKQVHQCALKLNTNVVVFADGFVGVKRFVNSQIDGFAFLTRKGQIFVYDMKSNQKWVINPASTLDHRCQSLAILNDPTSPSTSIYIGTDSGQIILITFQSLTTTYTQKQIYKSSSSFPILNIIILPYSTVLATTCEGQLLLLSQNLQNFSVVSAHHALVSRVLGVGSDFYTVGEDFVINKFQILGERKVKLGYSLQSRKIVSLLFELGGRAFMAEYENPRIKQL